MTKPKIDLSNSNYRLEAIPDHIDYTRDEMTIYQTLFLRLYASREHKDYGELYGRDSRGEDRSQVLFTIRRKQDEMVATAFNGADWETKEDTLPALVSKLITTHQLSSAGMDVHALEAFLTRGQRREAMCGTGSP